MSDAVSTPASAVGGAGGTSAAAPAATTEVAVATQIPTPEVAAKVEEAVKDLKKKYQLKVDGKEESFEIDLGNDEEVKKHLQLSKAAQRRMQETAKLRKDVDDLVTAIKSDPFAVLSNPAIGINVQELVNKYITEQLAEAEKSPEQKEKEAFQKEIEQLRKEKIEAKQRQEAAEMTALQEQAAIEIDTEITQALNSSSKLPKSPYVVKRVAETMMLAIQNGYADIKVADVIPVVERQINEEIQQMFSSMPEEVMEAVLGKGNLDRLRNQRIAKMKTPTTSAKDVKSSGTSPKEDKPRERIPLKQFLKGI